MTVHRDDDDSDYDGSQDQETDVMSNGAGGPDHPSQDND